MKQQVKKCVDSPWGEVNPGRMPTFCQFGTVETMQSGFFHSSHRLLWIALLAVGCVAQPALAEGPGGFAAAIQAAVEASKNAGPPPGPPPVIAKPLPPAKAPEPAKKPASQASAPAPAQPQAVPAKVTVPAAPAAAAAVPLPSVRQEYAEIYEKNVFDPKRQPWVEKVETPPPPPVPPITAADAELLGVMAFGSFKKAVFKLGPGFKFAPQPKNKAAPRPFVILAVGESLGPYTLVEVAEKKAVFDAAGTQYTVNFTPKKADRPPPSIVTPMAQAPVVLAAPTPTIVQGIEPIASAVPAATPQADAAAPAGGAAAMPAAAPAAPAGSAAAAAPAPAAAPAATPAGGESANPAPIVQGRTLLEAIEAARAAQAAGLISAPAANPFAR